MRDIEADYQAAVIAEYESLKRAGRAEEAAHVAQVLHEQYGHEAGPEPERQRAPEKGPERVDVPPPPEYAAEPQPKRRGPAKKTAAAPTKE